MNLIYSSLHNCLWTSWAHFKIKELGRKFVALFCFTLGLSKVLGDFISFLGKSWERTTGLAIKENLSILLGSRTRTNRSPLSVLQFQIYNLILLNTLCRKNHKGKRSTLAFMCGLNNWNRSVLYL